MTAMADTHEDSDGDQSGARPPSTRRRRPTRRPAVVIGVVVLLALVAGAIYTTVRGYQSASQATNKDYTGGLTPELQQVSNYFFVVVADVESVSPDTHTATVRLNFGETDTKYMDDAGVSDAHTLDGVTARRDRGSVLGLVELVHARQGSRSQRRREDGTSGGESSRYPFDAYDGELLASAKTSDGTVVPTLIVASNAADGWTVSKSLTRQGKSVGLSFQISRASDAQLYSIFIMALMWALAIAGVVIAFILLRNPKREVGADLLVYLAALLFALPLIRTLLPGNPGLGVLADFAVYFWVEAVVGVTLVLLLFLWVERNRPPHEHGSGTRVDEDLI